MKPIKDQPAGYAAPLGDGLKAALHADGSVALWGEGWPALTLHAGQVDALAALLAMGSALRSQQRRRRMKNLYQKIYGEEA